MYFIENFIVSHLHTLYVIFVLHLITILISENMFLTSSFWFYHIRDLLLIRRYIFLSVAKTIATALITSSLDYCNSLLYSIASKDILKLQCVQNRLARVVTRSPRFSDSDPLLKSLHWHPGQSCIIFKLFTNAYQTLPNGEHSYLLSRLSLAAKPR